MIGDWYRAFRGFYPRDNPPRDFISRFLFSARSIILVISAQAAMIAGLLALLDRHFDPLRFMLLLFAVVSLHAVSNLSNDYFDYRRGRDTPDSPRRRYTLHPIADNVITRKQILASLIVLLAIDLVICALFFHWAGGQVLAYAGIGMALLILYDATPVSLKEIGLGEIASFIVWGPLMICGGYLAITGQLSAHILAASVPYGLGVMTVLVGKHIDQADFDGARAIRTLPVILGSRLSRWFEITLILAMYIAVATAVVAHALPWPALVVFFNAPRAWRAIQVLAADRPTNPPDGYIGWPLWYHRFSLLHNKRFGWLYIAGLLAAVALSRLGI